MDSTKINTLIDQLLEALDGDWLLVGGALLHVLGISDRYTLDVDLVPLQEVTNKDQLKAIDVAVKNNLPPESINFAAEYFVKKQKNWKREIILLKQTKSARLFRPSRKLFKKLKLARGSEADLLDIKIFESKMKD